MTQWQSGWDVNTASGTDYAAMVECMESGIVRVLNTIEAAGQRDNTLVKFLYDHGGRHLVDSRTFFHGFGTVWEGRIRVPLILRWPGLALADTTIDQPAIAMDVCATILEASHLAQGHIDATDSLCLRPFLDGTSSVEEHAFFWRTDYPNFLPQRAVGQGDFKYLQDGQTQFLFNLSNDPGERENLLGRYPDLVNQLRSAHAAWAATMPE
jgi:arylsulfatase A-like enzyme